MAGDPIISYESHQQRPALDRAVRKAYWRLMPLLFICYVIAYVDRANVSIAKLTMTKDLPGFDNAVIGTAAGIFFIGYFLLEIPGSLICERWSARKWIGRIMITWGIAAALTSLVKTPGQFYFARFMLGAAEAGFFPGIIVFLSHWFPSRDRARALSYFLIATPFAQLASPKISNLLLKIGTNETVNGVTTQYPQVLGLVGWQWVYIAWGIPAVLLGLVVLMALTDHPHQAKWLTAEEREALEAKLAEEKALRGKRKRMTLVQGLSHPKVLLLSAAFFCGVTVNYGIEFFLPSILKSWYALSLDSVTWLLLLPPILAIAGQLLVGWSSDRTKERCLHAAIPLIIAGTALLCAPQTQGNLTLTIICFMVAAFGVKGYQPAFWSLPYTFLTEAAAAASIGLINSVGNLGGYWGPTLVGYTEKITGSFTGSIYYLGCSLFAAAAIILLMGYFGREKQEVAGFEPVIQPATSSR
jgi:ACS family tartrate transporter-like MFS transporter